MSEHDLLEVVEIEEQSGLSRWGWAAYYAELQGGNRELMLVAKPLGARGLDQDRIAGYIVARETAGELHVNNIAVRDQYRRRGYGSLLLGQVLELRARSRTGSAIKSLLGLAPKTTRVVKDDGSEHDYQFDFDPRSGRFEFSERDLLERDFGAEFVDDMEEQVRAMIQKAIAR